MFDHCIGGFIGSFMTFNTLRQNGRHFADDVFKCIFLNENVWISFMISLKFVPNVPINNIPALVQIMAWHRSGDKPLSEPIIVSLLTHIYASLSLNEFKSVFDSSAVCDWHKEFGFANYRLLIHFTGFSNRKEIIQSALNKIRYRISLLGSWYNFVFVVATLLSKHIVIFVVFVQWYLNFTRLRIFKIPILTARDIRRMVWVLSWATMSRVNSNYHQVSNIRRTKYQHSKDSRTVLRLSLTNPLKPDVKSRMKM